MHTLWSKTWEGVELEGQAETTFSPDKQIKCVQQDLGTLQHNYSDFGLHTMQRNTRYQKS